MSVIDGAAVVLQKGRDRETEKKREGGERERVLSSGHCNREAEISINYPLGDQ